MKDLSYSILLKEKLHFVRSREKSLWKSKSLWKFPDLTPPPANQSAPVASPRNENQSELNT